MCCQRHAANKSSEPTQHSAKKRAEACKLKHPILLHNIDSSQQACQMRINDASIYDPGPAAATAVNNMLVNIL